MKEQKRRSKKNEKLGNNAIRSGKRKKFKKMRFHV